MKNKILNMFIMFLLLTILFPTIVFAGGSSDDRVFTTTYEDGYDYGNVSNCNTGSGIAYFEGIENVSGYKVCLWNTKDKVKVESFKCEDSTMERFELKEVKDNNGVQYYGYGCRKTSDLSKVSFKDVYGVVGEVISSLVVYNDTFTIVEGDSVKLGKSGSYTTISGVKVGVTIVKKYNKTTGVAEYYKYHVSKAISSFSEYSSDYTYGNVSDCNTGSGIAYFEGIEDFSGYKVCLWNTKDKVKIESFKCEDGFMEKFDLGAVSLNGKVYYGYGCRKPKNADVVEYEKRELYVGYGAQLGNWATSKCEIISGDSVRFNKNGNCYIDAVKAGVSRVRVTDPKTSNKTYYEYTVYDLPNSIESLDDSYYYGNVSKCSLGAVGKKVEFSGYKFCASSAAGYNYEKNEVTCENTAFEIFKVAFTTDGKPYKGYGCRVLKSEYDKNSELPPIALGKMTCEDLFKDGDNYNSTWQLLSTTLRFMQYLGIILATVLSIVDFVKVVPTQDKDAINKASKKAVTRLVIAIVIFFVPIILDFILDLVGFSDPTCGLL